MHFPFIISNFSFVIWATLQLSSQLHLIGAPSFSATLLGAQMTNEKFEMINGKCFSALP